MKIYIPFTALAANVYNQDELTGFLDGIRETDPKIRQWIKKTLRKWMINNYPDQEPIKKVPAGAPDWARESAERGDLVELKFSGQKFNKFKLDLEHGLAYLKTVRDPARVGVEQAIKEGEKLIEKQNTQADSDEGEIKVLHEFKDGYKFVSCLDAKSLQREGKIMQHCVGTEQMGYIKKVNAGTLEIWSLRDPKDDPHCTIEYDVEEKKIEQIKGKQNAGVVKKYQPYVVEFLKQVEKSGKIEDFDQHDLLNIGILEVGGVWLDIYNLPDGLEIRGNLDLRHANLTSLPKGLKVGRDLLLNGSSITSLPEGLEVNRALNLMHTKITSLPEGLEIGGDLCLEFTEIKSLPEGLKIGGDLLLFGSKLTSLPKGLKVGGVLNLRNTKITSLSEGLEVKELYLGYTKITSLPEGLKVGGSLSLEDTIVESLPDGLEVGRSLNLRNSKITSLPKKLKVGGNLNITDTKIKSLPDDLKVRGRILKDF